MEFLRNSIAGASYKTLALASEKVANSALRSVFTRSLTQPSELETLILLTTVVYPVRSSALTAEAARAIANLSYYAQGEVKEQLILAGAIPELVKALQWAISQRASEVAHSCCMAIADLSLSSESGRREAARADGVCLVLEAASQQGLAPGSCPLPSPSPFPWTVGGVSRSPTKGPGFVPGRGSELTPGEQAETPGRGGTGTACRTLGRGAAPRRRADRGAAGAVRPRLRRPLPEHPVPPGEPSGLARAGGRARRWRGAAPTEQEGARAPGCAGGG